MPALEADPGSGLDSLHMQPLVGDKYYEAKRRLMLGEQMILRLTHFEISFEHPHKYLLNMARALHCPASTVQLAVCLVNDAMVMCDCCLRSSVAAVAGACLHLAALLSGQNILQDGWQMGLGLTEAETDVIGTEILTALKQAVP